MKSFRILYLGLIVFLLVGCQSKPIIQTVEVFQTKEVTRLAEVPVTQIVTVDVTKIVEVTRKVEVTRVVEKEVTRMVSIPSTGTPVPAEINPSMAFSMNYLGVVEQDGIKVELARVIFMHRDALKPDVSFDKASIFEDHEYVGEIIWRITNNTNNKIRWSYDDINVRVNDRQYKLYDYLFRSFGESPVDEIFPGSTIVGGVWFGIGNTKPDDITSVTLLMGGPYNPDTYDVVSGNFIITADLSGEHKWYPIPDELK